MKYINNDIRNFVTIREEGDPQRAFLLENYNGRWFETIMFGDEYHDGISDKIEGFLEGIAFAGIDFTHRTFIASDFGGDYTVKLYKRYANTNIYGDEFYIQTEEDGTIELTEEE